MYVKENNEVFDFYNKVKNKERTVNDLALFVKNRADEKEEESLYCMLLGSGASCSSNIRTGQDLVEIWRKELLLRYYPDEEYCKEKAVEKFKTEHSKPDGWYKEENEYCSFFGKIYDLPAQRRNFIEKEVAKACPSIGYLYLNRLVQHKYLNTFFTTNFDDLLEQSLSNYNDIKRPIVCAHDSSVKNISITLQRPKVIKLLGDFLFDDLKATNNDTEKLEKNIEQKFEEFLKNYGLIILGYAGNDDSIMTPLNNFIEKEEYLKNGLYWCIRKEDWNNKNISLKLQNLLLKDKVYYILIEHFDEFCANLAHFVLKDNQKKYIPFKYAPKQENVIEITYLQEQKKLFKDTSIIIENINDRLDSIDESSGTENYYKNPVIKSLSDSDPNNNEVTIELEVENELILAEEKDIKTLIDTKRYDEALEMIENLNVDENIVPSAFYNKFMRLKIECFIALENKESTLEQLNKIIDYNKKNKKNSNIPYLLKLSEVESDLNEQIKILEKTIVLDPYNSFVLNSLADKKEELLSSSSEYFKEIIDYYDQSIEVNPSINNEAYMSQLNFVINNKSGEEIIKTCDKIINKLEKQDPYSLSVFNSKSEKNYRLIKLNKENKEEYFDEIKKLFNEYITNNNIYERNVIYIERYMILCSRLNKNEELKQIIKKYDNLYNDNVLYQTRKSMCFLSNFRDLHNAINVLENIDSKLLKLNKKERIDYFSSYLNLLYYKQDYKKAYDIVNEQNDVKKLSSLEIYSDILFQIDQNKYLDIILKDFEESSKTTSDYVSYTYRLLKLREYDTIYSVYQDLLKSENQIVNKHNNVLLINYSLAKKRLDRKITKSNIEKIFQLKDHLPEKAAAYILIDNITEAEKILRDLITENYYFYYYLQKMPVFEQIDFEKFKMEKFSINS